MKSPPLNIDCPAGRCGTLSLDGSYFLSTPGTDPRTEVSLAIPHRADPYKSEKMHPIFQMNLPEGRILEEIRNRLAKTTTMDPMTLLALTGGGEPIGRLRTTLENAQMVQPGPGESLSEILAWDGAEDLFEMLFQRYVLRSAISGVQPKVLVPERVETPANDRKATTTTRDLIIKSGQLEYPHLAINEFVCMSIAKEAGIATPEFFLSDNHQLFVMQRFDRTHDLAMGFEDFAVLTGRTPEKKYEGSYEMVARALGMFASPEHLQSSLNQYFHSVVLSCMVGNGDAHLKNFGVLYTDPSSDDAQLSPAFDIVCTTMYLPDDTLALSLGGHKSLFAARAHLNDLADACGISNPVSIIKTLVEAAHAVLYKHDELIREAQGLAEAIWRGVHLFEEAAESQVSRRYLQEK
jgi:serine/threonine-protein kinase HipA